LIRVAGWGGDSAGSGCGAEVGLLVVNAQEGVPHAVLGQQIEVLVDDVAGLRDAGRVEQPLAQLATEGETLREVPAHLLDPAQRDALAGWARAAYDSSVARGKDWLATPRKGLMETCKSMLD